MTLLVAPLTSQDSYKDNLKDKWQFVGFEMSFMSEKKIVRTCFGRLLLLTSLLQVKPINFLSEIGQ